MERFSPQLGLIRAQGYQPLFKDAVHLLCLAVCLGMLWSSQLLIDTQVV